MIKSHVVWSYPRPRQTIFDTSHGFCHSPPLVDDISLDDMTKSPKVRTYDIFGLRTRWLFSSEIVLFAVVCSNLFLHKMKASTRADVVRLLEKSMKSCSSFYGLPYRYSDKRGFYLTTSKWELGLWKLNIMACLFVSVFSMSRMIQFGMDDNVPIATQVYLRLIVPVLCIPSLMIQIPTWRNGHDVVNLATQTANFFGSGKSSADLKTQDRARLLELSSGLIYTQIPVLLLQTLRGRTESCG